MIELDVLQNLLTIDHFYIQENLTLLRLILVQLSQHLSPTSSKLGQQEKGPHWIKTSIMKCCKYPSVYCTILSKQPKALVKQSFSLKTYFKF